MGLTRNMMVVSMRLSGKTYSTISKTHGISVERCRQIFSKFQRQRRYGNALCFAPVLPMQTVAYGRYSRYAYEEENWPWRVISDRFLILEDIEGKFYLVRSGTHLMGTAKTLSFAESLLRNIVEVDWIKYVPIP